MLEKPRDVVLPKIFELELCNRFTTLMAASVCPSSGQLLLQLLLRRKYYLKILGKATATFFFCSLRFGFLEDEEKPV